MALFVIYLCGVAVLILNIQFTQLPIFSIRKNLGLQSISVEMTCKSNHK